MKHSKNPHASFQELLIESSHSENRSTFNLECDILYEIYFGRFTIEGNDIWLRIYETVKST